MWPESEVEKEFAARRREQLRHHQWRVEHWDSHEKLRECWTPIGLTCPGCGADHCEVDGHFCKA